MNLSQLCVGTLALATAGAVTLAVHQFRVAEAVAADCSRILQRTASLDVANAQLEEKLKAATERAAAAERDQVALEASLKQTKAAQAKATSTAARESDPERITRALAQAPSSEPDTALRELLECLDLALQRPNQVSASQLTSVVNALARLGDRHPPAFTALRERFDQARQRVLGNADDTEPLTAMSYIARALKTPHAMVEVYDAIPEGDPRKIRAAIFAAEGLLELKRYRDLLTGTSFALMAGQFELLIQERTSRSADAAVAERSRTAQREYAVRATCRNIEILAGAGKVDSAAALSKRLLAYDGSETTLSLLNQHLARAGHPGLIGKIGK